MKRKQKDKRVADVVINPPAFLNRVDDGGKIIIQQHHARSGARDFRASLPHRDANIGFFHGWRVINAIACHSNNFTVFLQCLHQQIFLFRQNARENIMMLNRLIQSVRR